SVIDPKAKEDASGWAILPEAGKAHKLIVQSSAAVLVAPGDTLKIELRHNSSHASHALGHFRISLASDSQVAAASLKSVPRKEIADILSLPSDKRDKAQQEKLLTEFKKAAPELADLRKKAEAAHKAKTDFETSLPHCL